MYLLSIKFEIFQICCSHIRRAVSFCFTQPFSIIINLPLAAFPRSAYGYRQLYLPRLSRGEQLFSRAVEKKQGVFACIEAFSLLARLYGKYLPLVKIRTMIKPMNK